MRCAGMGAWVEDLDGPPPQDQGAFMFRLVILGLRFMDNSASVLPRFQPSISRSILSTVSLAIHSLLLFGLFMRYVGVVENAGHVCDALPWQPWFPSFSPALKLGIRRHATSV